MFVDPHNKVTQSKDRAALEDITHLTRKICLIWATPELDAFLSRLLMDARDGSQAQGLGQLLVMLLRSKWLAWAVVLILGAKFVWPTVKAVM